MRRRERQVPERAWFKTDLPPQAAGDSPPLFQAPLPVQTRKQTPFASAKGIG